ncbi:hypothetical protein GQ53DRAFT_785866 [Thozetella sp. PMI_491]|nr:hypothetical protein GQ53DRAFT_785866 [Thozetella sp. PMI_491]
MAVPSPSLYLLERPWTADPKLSLAHEFEDADGVSGIAEVADDTFVVVAVKYQGFGNPVPQSATVQEIKLYGDSRTPSSRIIASVPEAGLLNGIINLDHGRPAILAADSVNGVVYRVDVETGKYEIAIDIPETKASLPAPSFPFGVNGIKLHNGYLYWTNTNAVSIYRLRVNEEGSPVKGAQAELVAKLDSIALDDFIIDDKGTVWAMTNADGRLIAIRADGTTDTVLGSPTELTIAGDTAGQFGRTPQDRRTLYITTCGGLYGPVNGTLIEPAKVVAVDTSAYY